MYYLYLREQIWPKDMFWSLSPRYPVFDSDQPSSGYFYKVCYRSVCNIVQCHLLIIDPIFKWIWVKITWRTWICLPKLCVTLLGCLEVWANHQWCGIPDDSTKSSRSLTTSSVSFFLQFIPKASVNLNLYRTNCDSVREF